MRDELIPVVDVLPLTPELVRTCNEAASVALSGDGTCSLENVAISCFASEACARGQSPLMDLAALVSSRHSFVALHEGNFVGCVSAHPCRLAHVVRLFPDLCFGPEDLLLSNLCVAHACRGQPFRAGRKLIETVLDVAPANLYLLVALGPCLEERSANLRRMYAHLGFREVVACERAVLMRYEAHPRPNRPTCGDTNATSTRYP